MRPIWKHIPRTPLGLLSTLAGFAIGVGVTLLVGAILDAPLEIPVYAERRLRADAVRHMVEDPRVLASILSGVLACAASLWIFSGYEVKRAWRRAAFPTK